MDENTDGGKELRIRERNTSSIDSIKVPICNRQINGRSNDGREIKHLQERPYERKWTDKSDVDRTMKRPEYQKQKSKEN